MGGRRGRLITATERNEAIALVMEAVVNSARRHKACEMINISARTLERWKKLESNTDGRMNSLRKTPANKLTEAEREELLGIANQPEYCNLSPHKIVPLLADKGIYIASESTFYRILKEENQLAHRLTSKPKKHHKPKALTTKAPNQVWCWDITYLPQTIYGKHFYLYMIIDIYSRKVVGWSVHERESDEYASSLIKQACYDEKVPENQLVLHSDNGKPMKGATMLSTLQTLGVVPSFSRPSVSDDNPYSESLFKTLKYQPGIPLTTRFDVIADAREWVEKFVQWYNHEHLHSGIKFVTPQQRHQGIDKGILRKRHAVYTMAKLRHPERWTGNTRDWRHISAVALNPDKKNKQLFSDNKYKEAA